MAYCDAVLFPVTFASKGQEFESGRAPFRTLNGFWYDPLGEGSCRLTISLFALMFLIILLHYMLKLMKSHIVC